MRLSDGYECEVKEESADSVGRFQGIQYTLNQAPITRKCIFDGNTGMPITKAQYKAMTTGIVGAGK